MTTSQSPLSQLKKQANKIAKMLKEAERGMGIMSKHPKLAEIRANNSDFVVGIAMDDKLIKLSIPWACIQSYGEVALAEYILKLMKGTADVRN